MQCGSEMAKALATARLGFRRLFSISAFTPPPAAPLPPKAEPSTNLFISGLSKRTTSEGLREAFSKFGEVIHARVVTDRVSGYSKGFGFVRYASLEDAGEGINGMDGKFLDGWVIFAEYARPRPPPSQDQSSQPQMNYGSSPMSQSSSFYPSATTPNYSSSSSLPPPPPNSSNYSQTTPPPFSNSYYAPPTSQPQQSYEGSVPPSNYDSSQAQSNYSSSYFNHSSSPPPPTPPINGSAPPSSNYESVHYQSSYASSYYNHSNGSQPPFNYSSDISQPTSNSSMPNPPWHSPQTTQHYTHSQYGSAPTTNHSSQAPQQGFGYTPLAADPAPGYASAAQNDSVKTESPPSFASASHAETFETGSSYCSERQSEYEPGRAANY